MRLVEQEEVDVVAPSDLVAPAAVGPTAARLAVALTQGDLVCVAIDEPRASALAAALAGAAPDAHVVHLPAPDALPGEDMPSSPANIGSRHMALHALGKRKRGQHRAMILSIEAALIRVPPPAMTAAAPLGIAVGDRLSAESLAETLAGLGYQSDDRIDEPGEMRGAAEVFPTGEAMPVRLDIEDGRVVSIRAFDPLSQRSTDALDEVMIAPAIWPAPAQDWVSPLEHLGGAVIAIDPGVDIRRAQLAALHVESGGRSASAAVSAKQWASLVDGRSSIDIAPREEVPGERFVEQQRPDRAAMRAIRRHLTDGDRVVLAGTKRDLRYLTRRMDRKGAPEVVQDASWTEAMSAPDGTVAAVAMPIDAGWRDEGIVVIAAADVLGSRAGMAVTGPATGDPLAAIGTFAIGDVVVHEDHGVGVLRGLQPIELDGRQGEVVRIEYAKERQRLIPVEETDRLWRYGADADAVTLDGLDGASWAKRRGDVDAAVAATARALTALAAERAKRETAPLVAPAGAYERFVGRFPFTATRDQLRAIEAVRADLASGRPMDRLVVGDVGYGKTEVALRAAAIAALAGRQVALIAPTTVLVRQHLDSFARRFADLDITVASLSRLSGAAEARAVKAGLADGSIRIVIGTQALAAKGVTFADLALVIIDEEQRFGAADKAKLRRRVGNGHVLTLTATPIPRTLQGALVGLQDISVIATPPARRQPIRTSTGPFDADELRKALLRERSRGGQSFVVVPRIEDIEPLAAQLERLVPELTVRQAHGKMAAAEIDAALVGFAGGDGDVLLATNIIEAGLDVPRANLMCVMHADRFGLAQLHQIRGRVGRGARRGTILLMTAADRSLSPATLKRLKTLEALDHLGAGFAISARDLDQRGAGDLFGEDQAGHARLIGLDLYQHLLAGALASPDGKPPERWSPQVHVAGDAMLPSDWIAEEETRLDLYVRLARLSDDAAVDNFAEELEDRFGALPEPAQRLIALARIRTLAHGARVARIDAGPGGIALTPRPDFAGDTAGLEPKDGRLLLRGEHGPDLLAAVTDLLRAVLGIEADDSPGAS